MSRDGETFLRRWARRKARPVEAAAPPPPAPPQAEARALPPVEALGPDSDFAAFMTAKVDETVRRAALRKLFADPRFNVMDGLDIYIDDYTREDPIPQAMLAGLEHARDTLFGPRQADDAVSTAGPDAASADDPAPAAPPRRVDASDENA